MTPEEQDKELREKLTKLISQDGWVDIYEVDVDGQVNELMQLIAAYTNKQIEAVLDRLELSMRGKTIVDTAEGWQKFVKRHVVTSIEAERNNLKERDDE